jgi:hypothetical protein
MVFHLSSIEVITFITSLIVLVVSVHAVFVAITDQAIAVRDGSIAKRIVADSSARVEWLKVTMSITMLIGTGSSLFLEPPPPEYSTLPQSMVLGICWVCLGILIIISSMVDKVARRKLIQLRQGTLPSSGGRRVTDNL